MNNKIKLAVAGAVLSAASAANAGIIIPAGDWTIDINGNVNAFAIMTDANDKTQTGTTVVGGLASTADADNEDRSYAINTGLLPAWLGFTGTTRQNDLDVSFTISFQPNVSDNQSSGMGDVNTPLNRQAFVTFGDKSWGSVKLGKDLGIFAGDAILNDMTLLGVGLGGSRSGGATTLGGIGSGYIYPAWKGQIAYTTPNMNGFQATIAITNPDQGQNNATGTATPTGANGGYNQDRFGIEGKASYSWTGDVAGKVWASFASYDRTGNEGTASTGVSAGTYIQDDYTTTAYDIGASITSGNLGLVAYYYDADGAGLTTNLLGTAGVYASGSTLKKRESDGGYVQATYVIPTGTKLGVAYGVSNLDEASGETGSTLLEKNERWTVGAYHPLTKHLNLVAEYNRAEAEAHNGNDAESDSVSLGAILFF
jgi:predicted porin